MRWFQISNKYGTVQALKKRKKSLTTLQSGSSVGEKRIQPTERRVIVIPEEAQ